MKKLALVAVLVAALCAACTDNYEEMESSEKQVKTMSVRFGGDFAYRMSTRTTAAAEKVQDVWVFDYKDGVLVQTIRKSEFDSDITSPKVAMEYGNHVLYYVLSYGKYPTLEDYHHQIVWGNIGETFWKKVELTVDAKTSAVIEVTLDRMVTMLKVESEDVVPDGVEFLNVTPSKWYSGLDYITGNACSALSYKNYIYDIRKSGEKVETWLYGFTDGHETEIAFTAKKNGVVVKKSMARNVPFKANRVTKLTGILFAEEKEEATGGEFGFNLQTNEEWEEEWEMTW
jgi:hypothetical protein